MNLRYKMTRFLTLFLNTDREVRVPNVNLAIITRVLFLINTVTGYAN